jgi:hypothetical protein
MIKLLNRVQEKIKDSQDFILDVLNIPTNQDKIKSNHPKLIPDHPKSKKRKKKRTPKKGGVVG